MLGLRFRDATTERPVTDGLRVTVRRDDGAGRPARAVRTASGAYVAQRLAGLRPYERSAAFVPEGSVPYRVLVEDVHRRFVPVLLQVDLPYVADGASNGLYPIVESPSDLAGETPEPTCYLFSAVQRSVTAGQAVVYADLVVERGEGDLQPAAHAVLKIRHDAGNGGSNGNANDEDAWYGVADADGRVAVQFPLPSVQLEELRTEASSGGNGGSGHGRSGNGGSGNSSSGNGSRTSVGGQPLSTRTWPLAVSVRYDPPSLDVPDGAGRPLLPSIFQQKAGALYAEASTPQVERSVTLSYSEPLVLRTAGLSGGRSALRIAPHDDRS